MRLPDGERFDDALDLVHDHRWRAYKPQLGEDQLAELLVVLEPWFREEFARSRSRVPNRKPAKVDKGSQQRGRRLVGIRSAGMCEIQVTGVCTGRGAEWCHRRARSQGGTWSPANGLRGCRECHAWTHANPHAAQQNGWAVPSFGEPAERPVLRMGEWVVLDDDGCFRPTLAVVGGGFSAVETNEVETT